MLHNNSAVGLLRNARTAGNMDKHIIVIHLKPYIGYIQRICANFYYLTARNFQRGESRLLMFPAWKIIYTFYVVIFQCS